MIKTYKFGEPFELNEDTLVQVFLCKGTVTVLCHFEEETPSINVEGASTSEMFEEDGMKGIHFMFDFSIKEGAVTVNHSGKFCAITWERVFTHITLTDWNGRKVTLRVKSDGLYLSHEELSAREKRLQNCEVKLSNEINMTPEDSPLRQALEEALFDVKMQSVMEDSEL